MANFPQNGRSVSAEFIFLAEGSCNGERMKALEKRTGESIVGANGCGGGEQYGQEMGEPIVFSGGIKNLVGSAKENGCGQRETHETDEQGGPGHMEAQAPNECGYEDENVNEKPVRERSHVD